MLSYIFRIMILFLVIYVVWKMSLFLIPLIISGVIIAGIAISRSSFLKIGLAEFLERKNAGFYQKNDSFERDFHHANQQFFRAPPPPPPSASSAMTITEACQILGVSQNTTPEDIKKAYHHLMKKMHPDQGGSTYLAEKINQARDILLKK